MSCPITKVTQKEIALRAGVQQGTVSAVLCANYRGHTKVSLEIREKILKIAQELHYVPNLQARALRGCASNQIGVLLNYQISQHFYDILLPLEQEIHAIHKRMLISQIDNNPNENRQVLKNFINYNLDGIIVLHHDLVGASELFSSMIDILPPIVFLDKPPQNVNASYVAIDYGNGVRLQVEQFFAMGCRRIALCMGDLHHYNMIERMNGYRAGLKNVGLPYNDALVYARQNEQRLEPLDRYISVALDTLLAASPDVILCSNDFWALGLLKELTARSIKVPDDILLAGYGNTLNICMASTPELASVVHQNLEIAQKLVALLSAPRGSVDFVHTEPILRRSALRDH